MSKNIEMNYLTGSGYEVLYPTTNSDVVQVNGLYSGTLTNVFDSLISPELIITTTPGASITATSNEVGVNGNANDDGLCVLPLKEYGTYTVVASLMGVSAQGRITVDTVKQYPMTLKLTELFGSMSWANINTLLSQGKTSLFNVGDVKTLTLNGTAGDLNFSNTTAYATIIGINHNASREGINKLHLQLALDSANTKTLGNAAMNATETNEGGWGSCQMRTRECANLLNCLPSDLQVVVKTTTKYTSAGDKNTSIVSSSDKIFLLSEFEIFGAITYSASGEKNYQQQYSWYSNHSKAKDDPFGSASWWWGRSPFWSSSSHFCSVIYDSGDASNAVAYAPCGVAPCLCI